MGSNKNKKTQPAAAPTQAVARPGNSSSPISPTNPIFQESGSDPRGRIQNTITDERARYRGQMDPYMDTLGEGFGNAMEMGQRDYGDIMNRFSGMASGMNPISARSVSYTDPFASYGQFQDMSRTGGYDIPNNDAYQGYKGFADTGGYSAGDIADLRARGVAPIRAAYANAGREVSRQRSLQGGYSPNAAAVQAKMAREQSQFGADALQNVNAGIIDSRNQGRLAGMQGMAGIDTNRIGNQFKGLAGMSDIENARLGAQLQAGTTNAQLAMQADQFNQGNQLNALQGMSSLYGTTPGMANMFGNQLGNAIGNSGQQGSSYISGETGAQGRPGAFDTATDRIGQVADIGAAVGNPLLDYYNKRKTGGTTTGKPVNSPYPWENDAYGG